MRNPKVAAERILAGTTETPTEETAKGLAEAYLRCYEKGEEIRLILAAIATALAIPGGVIVSDMPQHVRELKERVAKAEEDLQAWVGCVG